MPYILVVEEGRSRLVRERKYKAEKGEATLQDLVEKYPRLLPLPGVEVGDLVILTVQREYRATDLLCVDSEGGVIIVECNVTFIPEEDQEVDLRARGFTTELASELRQRLLTFEEDWNAPGMEAYDKL